MPIHRRILDECRTYKLRAADAVPIRPIAHRLMADRFSGPEIAEGFETCVKHGWFETSDSETYFLTQAGVEGKEKYPLGGNSVWNPDETMSLLREMARNPLGEIVMPNTMGAGEEYYIKRRRLEILIDQGYADWTGPQESIARLTDAGFHRVETLLGASAFRSLLESDTADPEGKGDRKVLFQRIEALDGITEDEANILSELIARHNNATKEDPVGKSAWDWIREKIQESHAAFSNLLRTTETLNRIYNAACNFWGIAKTILGTQDPPPGT